MADRRLVERKLNELDIYLRQLSLFQAWSLQELTADLGKAWAVLHGLQLSVQVVLDIGNHILADRGVAVEEYADIFQELARLNVIPQEFAEQLQGMAGFRNVIVHEYAKVDMAKVYDVLINHLSDFRTFARYVADCL